MMDTTADSKMIGTLNFSISFMLYPPSLYAISELGDASGVLKEARQDRRAAKDAISELDPICGWARENARVLKSLEQLLGNVRKAEKATQNRYYSDRTDAVERSIRHEQKERSKKAQETD